MMTPGLVRRLIIHSLVVWATMPLFTTNRHIRQTSSFWCVRALSTTPSTQPPKPTASTASALNDAFRSKIEGQLILAPLTRGGNLPFRRLCSDFGMEVSYSEMVYSRFLVKGDRVEATRLRRPDNEKYFGVQIATNQVDEGVKAMQMAYDSGADFVDLNCGCPIYEATRRGLGSSLLRSPKKLEQLVAGMVQEGGDRIPLSVKIRLGCSEDSINVREVVDRMRNAGAAAVTIHARTARQGYRRPADWDMIRQVVEDGKAQGSAMPIIGNGDILTHYEATRRMEETGVNACMVGRGALIKPWIFQEFKDRQEWEPTLSDRIEIYYKLTSYMKDYFGSDDLGRKKASYFLPWHFSFFNRYRSYPEESFCDESLTSPLIHRRIELPDDALPLDILFQHSSEDAHTMIADTLWNSGSSADAVQQLQKLAESKDFQEIRERAASEVEDEDKEDTTELANVPKDNKKSQWKGRKGRGRRGTKPDRTPEEIAAIRAQRAAKKARLEAEQKSLEAHNETIVEQATRGILSRRAAFQYGGVLVTGSILTTLASQQTSHLPDQKAAKPKPPSLIPQPVLKPKQEPPSTTASSPVTKKSGTAPSGTTSNKPQAKTSSTTKQPSMIDSVLGRLEPINLTQVASETNINVTLTCSEGCISVDSKNFTKIQQAKFPPWFPSWLKKSIPPKVVKQISDPELLVASTVAGASMEMFRTGLLYPLSTIKVRVQQDRHNFTCRPPPLSEKIVILGTNIKEKVQEGNLYAGITPTLLVSAPATGVYYGFRDVTKRMLTMTPLGDTWVAVSGAFVGDVVSLCFRTPADALALRLQAQNETVGDWLGDSLARLPMVIATDLPYLLSKVVLNRLFIQGSLSVDKYAELAVFTAVIAAFFTTPFDLARTRILLDKQLTLEDDSAASEEKEMIWDTQVDGELEEEEEESNTPAIATTRPGYSVLQTMIQITKEGDGGVANLFAGWLERVLYLGIGRAWLEPVQLIGYIGIRDAVLLEWF